MSSPDNTLVLDQSSSPHVLDVFDNDETIVLPGVHPASCFRRIRRMLDYSHPYERYYSLSRIPADAGWDADWSPTALCHEGLPLRIRFVGTIHALDELVQGLDLLLCRVVDHNAHIRLLRLGEPGPVRFPETVALYPTCAVDTLDLGELEVFDATARLRPREFMTRIAFGSLSRHDLVLVEAACVQQDTSEGWDVAFEPLHVFLLRRAV
ncbi:hypothetical protein FKP32DRAFT_1671584 [Trametes sanguinea]|nr:hypothetical protein FKP32DRAFT_1671584 [Trametes sanguinea]